MSIYFLHGSEDPIFFKRLCCEIKRALCTMRGKDFKTKDLHAECREKQELLKTNRERREAIKKGGGCKGLSRNLTQKMYTWQKDEPSGSWKFHCKWQMCIHSLKQPMMVQAVRLTGEAVLGTLCLWLVQPLWHKAVHTQHSLCELTFLHWALAWFISVQFSYF